MSVRRSRLSANRIRRECLFGWVGIARKWPGQRELHQCGPNKKIRNIPVSKMSWNR